MIRACLRRNGEFEVVLRVPVRLVDKPTLADVLDCDPEDLDTNAMISVNSDWPDGIYVLQTTTESLPNLIRHEVMTHLWDAFGDEIERWADTELRKKRKRRRR